MNERLVLFFDVDQTLAAQDGSLRPHAAEILQYFHAQGYRIVLWSAAGKRSAWAKRAGIDQYVDRYATKPFPLAGTFWNRIVARFKARHVICIDDDAEVIAACGGVLVAPYWTSNADDSELPKLKLAIEQGRVKQPLPLTALFDWVRLGVRTATFAGAALSFIVGMLQLLVPGTIVLNPLMRPSVVLADLGVDDCDGRDWAGADVTIETDTLWGGTHYNIGTLTVNNGVTLNVCSSGNGGNGTLTVGAENIVIAGTINGDGKGATGGAGGSGLSGGVAGTGGCSAGVELCPSGNGGGGGALLPVATAAGGGGGGYAVGGTGGSLVGIGGSAFGTTTDTLVQQGSGGGGGVGGGLGDVGGNGGSGGASIRLIADAVNGSITGAGIVTANGATGTNGTASLSAAGGGGGGSGGGVYFRAQTVNFTGTVRANGGNGGSGQREFLGLLFGGGGGGGGGRIKCHGVTLTNCGNARSATAGTGGAGSSGAAGSAGTAGSITNFPEASPTAVDVLPLTVQRTENEILIRWRTASEVGTVGFAVMRGMPDQGFASAVLVQSVPAVRSGDMIGATYRVIDADEGIPDRVCYWLVETTTKSEPVRHKPVCAEIR